MRTSGRIVPVLIMLFVVLAAVPGSAGPEKIAFPASYKDRKSTRLNSSH